ncbi:protein FAR1-RELATED SEQUENCE 5-like [Camellia sinensis]|uniref:protein FAR1-RELATED SEQUENCE 5-like n=1 Tax=Camellia sinensis TaxID=4442 RepID=UPI001036B647|nr:protein FAR1-RELATED SEQUENCE 5-like [Camellia sinensis]
MDDGGLEGCIEEMGELAKDKSPYLGMELLSEEAAYEFYNEYGRIVGFSIRRDYCNKSQKDGVMTSRKFVCCKEGERKKDKRYTMIKNPRSETRTNCKAFMHISFKRDLSKWIVSKFDSNHNHPLHLPQCTHLMPSQRKVCDAQGINIDIADESGISLKASHDLISAIAGGKKFVGFTREDQKTYLRAKRQRNLQYGEAGSLLRYFQQQVAENPYFYYAIQLDVDEMITNIFWADHQMITDYGLFGDAVSFDTTFRTNKEYRPLALFCGFNHFRMTVIFGAALLYDETAESFEWLFETFLDAMLGKKPVSFFTDQDQAMAKAISQIMPEVFHGLCTFHLMQNALKHLGYLFKSGSKFSSDLKACIYDYENEDELIEAWNSLIDKYNLQENEWMKRTWRKREQWAHVYMKWIVVDKRYEEISAIYDSRQKLPRMKLKKSPILIQVRSLYTPPIFDLFHCELDTSLCCQVKQFHELEGEVKCVIGLYGNGKEYIVEGRVEVIGLRGEKSCQEIHCTCKKFENFGILYSHAIKALDRMNVMKIPERYILGRWRLDAKDCEVEEKNVVVDEDDPKLLILARYRDLCPRMVKLATQASMHKPAYQLVDEGIKELCVKVNNMMKGVGSFGTNELDVDDPNITQVKGIKKKDVGHKGRGRLKPWHEMMNKKTKVISQPTRLSKVLPTYFWESVGL